MKRIVSPIAGFLAALAVLLFGVGPALAAIPPIPPPAPAYAPKTLRQVAAGSFITTTFNTTWKQAQFRSEYIATDDITSLQLVYWNGYVSDFVASLESALGSASSNITSYVEYPAGTYKAALFAGTAVGVVGPKALGATDVTAIQIPKGAHFWVQTRVENTDGIVYSAYTNFNNRANAGATLANTLPSASITPVTTFGYGPAAIIAYSAVPAVWMDGDSITQGVGDTPDIAGNRGIIARSIGPLMGYINAGVGGDFIQRKVIAGNYAVRSQLAAYTTCTVSQGGHNDLYIGIRTAAQLATDSQTFYALPGIAGKPIVQTTIPPKTTSSDAWITVTNQTANSSRPAAITYNNTLRAGVANVSAVADTDRVLSAYDAAANDNTKFDAPEGNAMTTDGAHPNRFGYWRVQSSGMVQAAVLSACGR